eukprot:CAMPEP_0113517924 /NCGR_PEP_ID=MMETSP0014_2-20120614/42544_1 /TAXON_ID=2857 /ORGANISM="Nitzschia sp." /LENGTH=525 /DNA_ID=CAMNT_0000415205 /DNA_START=804 /DNA_END=2380 /DNA_ORIENTATION=+ /assembly_acc=CAM_ASM_000159
MAYPQAMVPPPPPLQPSLSLTTKARKTAAGASGRPRPPPPPPPPKKGGIGTPSSTASASSNTARRTPQQPPPPPPPPKRTPPPPPPPKSNGKSPVRRVAPPPPPPPPKNGSGSKNSNSAVPPTKRTVAPSSASSTSSALSNIRSPLRKKSRRDSVITIKAPTILRDVQTAYIKDRALGEGMYGEVFIGKDRSDGSMAALKLIKTEQEQNGFPITTLREVKILKALQHPNIVHLKEIVVSKEQKEGTSFPEKVFMAFELCEYDLVGLMETPEIRLSQDHIKSWSYQLLQGTHYMHKQRIIHRDLKLANILVNHRGELKIADWGLARSWNPEMRHLTNPVVTLWYRPPELLLGTRAYSPKIDMWSVGCMIAEMFRRRPGFLHPRTQDEKKQETDMTKVIFEVCGTPTEESWPGIGKMCPKWREFSNGPVLPNRLAETLRVGLSTLAAKWLTDDAVDLISHLMEVNPHKRWDAEKALDAEWFFQQPMKKKASELSMNFAVKSVHEKDVRDEKRREGKRFQLRVSSCRK